MMIADFCTLALFVSPSAFHCVLGGYQAGTDRSELGFLDGLAPSLPLPCTLCWVRSTISYTLDGGFQYGSMSVAHQPDPHLRPHTVCLLSKSSFHFLTSSDERHWNLNLDPQQKIPSAWSDFSWILVSRRTTNVFDPYRRARIIRFNYPSEHLEAMISLQSAQSIKADIRSHQSNTCHPQLNSDRDIRTNANSSKRINHTPQDTRRRKAG